jgi:hypothetical protein
MSEGFDGRSRLHEARRAMSFELKQALRDLGRRTPAFFVSEAMREDGRATRASAIDILAALGATPGAGTLRAAIRVA